jgi:hypothetical protein
MSDLTIEERLARLERALTFHDDGRVELRCDRVVISDPSGRERILLAASEDRAHVVVATEDVCNPYRESFVELYADRTADEVLEWTTDVGVYSMIGGSDGFSVHSVADVAEDTSHWLHVGEAKVAEHHTDRLVTMLGWVQRDVEKGRFDRIDLDKLGEAIERRHQLVDAIGRYDGSPEETAGAGR